MKITSSNGFFANGLSSAGQGRKAQASKAAQANTPQANSSVRQQIDSQKQRHLSDMKSGEAQ